MCHATGARISVNTCILDGIQADATLLDSTQKPGMYRYSANTYKPSADKDRDRFHGALIMDPRTVVALVGMAIGTVLLLMGRKPESPRELRWSGMFVLIASLCFLLGIEVPKGFPLGR